MKHKKRCLFSALAGLAVAAGILWSSRIWTVQDRAAQILILCDAFAVPGCLLLLCGGLLWAAGKGAFGGLPFARRVLRGEERRDRKTDGWGQIFQQRGEERYRKDTGAAPLLLAGGVLMLPAIVLTVLYYWVR